ncbi:hypothetical protein ATCC90586_005455 [Pythium insidiosum]|nr:hypothetical protein ATCC90586_005455 [Pythium insidiosum]
MQSSMRTLLLIAGCCLALTTVGVAGAECPKICQTRDLWGRGPGGTSLCQCDDGVGPNRTGPGGCSCGVCYQTESGKVVAYGYASGKCSFGVDCDSKKNDDSGMATWQIALIICSAVLVFAVAMMTLMSCYCKTRKEMEENDTLEDDRQIAPSPGASNFTSSDLTELPFECAEVRVPLCHDGICKSDRSIELFIKRVRVAKSGNKKALWLLQGGPGASSSGLESLMLSVSEKLEGGADIYTMDHRGTGRSHFLKCDAAQAFSTGSPGGANIDYREVPNCVKDILFQIDGHTSAFSITSAAKDMDLLIKTLNKDQEAYVYGASYGTYLTSRLMHLAPTAVKGYVLDGVWSESIGTFANFNSHRDEPGKYFASLCEKNEVCKSKYAYGLEQHGDLFKAWRSTYEKLDSAGHGKNACADLLRGDYTASPSFILRYLFTQSFKASDPDARRLIPAIFHMADRCNDEDLETLQLLMPLKPGQNVSSLFTDQSVTPVPFDEVEGMSFFLMFLIKASEMWTFPSPSWAAEKKVIESGVFGLTASADYDWYCLLNGDLKDPSCEGLLNPEQSPLPYSNISGIQPVKFIYERDEYYRKTAKVPDHASAMVMNGKLDFQTIHSWAEDEYKNLVGKKMLVEFDHGPHCIAMAPTTPDDTTECGARILASYVAVSGDVDSVDVSCMSELPEISFDVEAEIAEAKKQLEETEDE